MAAARDDDKPTELRRIHVEEISLVDHPANKRKFLLFKRDEHPNTKGGDAPMALTKEETEALQKALNTPYDSEQALAKALDEAKPELSVHAKNAAKAAYRLLKLYGDDIGADMLAQLSELAGVTKAVEPEPKVEPKAPAADIAELEKRHTDALAKRDEQISALTKAVSGLVDEKDTGSVEELVKAMNLPGMAVADQVALFKSLPAEVREKFSEWAPAITKAIDLSGRGSSRPGAPISTGSAQDKLMKAAEEIVKADTTNKTKLPQAIQIALEREPELATDMRAEYPISAARPGEEGG